MVYEIRKRLSGDQAACKEKEKKKIFRVFTYLQRQTEAALHVTKDFIDASALKKFIIPMPNGLGIILTKDYAETNTMTPISLQSNLK